MLPSRLRAPIFCLAVLLSASGCRCTEDPDDPVCGNGVVETGEECDDGGTNSGDGCSASCLNETPCGNTILDPGEACDDGNTTSFDGCENDCTLTPDEFTCEVLTPLASGTCEVTAGSAETLFVGTVLHPRTILRGGKVLVDAAGVITCVGCDCVAAGATVVSCPTGVISPGLINAHDHITFIQNDPYVDRATRPLATSSTSPARCG